MHWQYIAYTLPLSCAATLSALLAVVAWRRQPVPGATPAAVLMLAVAGWCLAYAFVIESADLPAKVLWAKIAALSVTLVATAWLVFVLEYAGRNTWLTRRTILILAIEPLITLLLIWTNDVHGLFWSRVELDTSGSLPGLDTSFGPWFWIDTLYAYLLLAVGVILLLHLLFQSPRPYRGQITALVIAVIIPWGAHITHIAGLSPIPHLDPTPFAFTLTGVVLIWGIVRSGLLDMAPIARSAVVESITDGIIFVDTQNRIVDINPAAQSMVNQATLGVVGKPAAQVFDGWPDLFEKRDTAQAGQQTEVTLGEGEARRYFDLRSTALHDWRGRTIGQLIVLHDVTEHKQMEEMLRDSEAALQHRAEELAALHATSLEITARHELPTLLHTIVERAAGLLDAPSGGLYLCDPERREVRCVVSFNTPQDYTGTVLEYGEGAAGQVAETGEPLIIDDYRIWPHQAATFKQGQPFTAVLSAPMIWQGQVTGVIHVLDNTENRRFTPDDLNLLTLFANQAAIAVENARLLGAEREQLRLAEALREVGWELTAELDLNTLLEYIVSRAIELLDGEGGGLYLYRPERDVLEWVVTLGPSVPPAGPVLRRGEGLAGKVWEAGGALSIDDYENWDGRAPLYEGYTFGAVVGAPIRWGHEFLGVLAVHRSDQAFSESEAELLSLFTTQAAIAIKNAYLFEAERRRAQEAETLRQAGAVVVATLHQGEAIERILEQLARVVPYESATVQLLREEGYVEIVGGRGWQSAADVVGLRFPVPGDNPNSVVIQEGRPHILTDARAAYPAFREGPHSHIQSWLGVPLTYRSRVIGMLAVDSTQPRRFTPDHARLATAFGNQVAIALENARLFEAERRRHRELEALRQANLQLTSSLELQPVLEAILDHALKLVAGTDAHVFLCDGERLTFGAACWRDGREQTPYAEPRPGGLTHTVAQSGEQIVIPDVNAHPLFQDWQWGGAIIGLPLCLGDQVRGVMNVAFDQPHTFDEGELRVLNLLADQAAIAIRNAQLHAEVQAMATTDDLTGLYNRRGFFELGRREVERAMRFDRPLTAIMFDLDRFKRVNDACGHVVGDHVLARLAKRCRQELRAVDLLGRYGGEEFAVLLPETGLTTAEEVAERLRHVVDQTRTAALCDAVSITASLGVAALNEECTDLEDLLERADEALYVAKRSGRNRVCVYDQADTLAETPLNPPVR